MKYQSPFLHDDLEDPLDAAEEADQASEKDLWFLPGPMEEERDFLPPGPGAAPRETSILADWAKAGAGFAARLGAMPEC